MISLLKIYLGEVLGFGSRWDHLLLQPLQSDNLWDLLGSDAEQHFLQRSGESLTLSPRRYRGRGREHLPREAPAVAPQRPDIIGALSSRQLRTLRLLRRVEELIRWHHRSSGPGSFPQSICALWHHI